MTPENFYHWLKGLLDLQPNLKTLDELQVAALRRQIEHVKPALELKPAAPTPPAGPWLQPPVIQPIIVERPRPLSPYPYDPIIYPQVTCGGTTTPSTNVQMMVADDLHGPRAFERPTNQLVRTYTGQLTVEERGRLSAQGVYGLSWALEGEVV